MRFVRSLLPMLLLAVGQAGHAQTSSFAYERPVVLAGSGQACAVVDPAIFAHAAPALRDLRLFSSAPAPAEIPYILTVSEAQQTETEAARILHLTASKDGIAFDLAMPPRAYTDVHLDLAGEDFIATADVSGARKRSAETNLGHFTLFDLSTRHLSRSTTLTLQESTFPLLHVRLHLWNERTQKPTILDARAAAQFVRGAAVPPSRERQALFNTALSAPAQTVGRETVARFALPQHVPVERVRVTLVPGATANFSRTVRVAARPAGSDAEELASGVITRVHLEEAGQPLRHEEMTVNATIGANLQSAAEVQVTIENGPEAPLPVASIELEVRQRSLCFHAGPEPLTLFYGDPGLRASSSSRGESYLPAAHILDASFGPESANPAWRPQPKIPAAHPQEPRHLVWIVLLGLAFLLGIVAVRSTRIVRH